MYFIGLFNTGFRGSLFEFPLLRFLPFFPYVLSQFQVTLFHQDDTLSSVFQCFLSSSVFKKVVLIFVDSLCSNHNNPWLDDFLAECSEEKTMLFYLNSENYVQCTYSSIFCYTGLFNSDASVFFAKVDLKMYLRSLAEVMLCAL